MEMNWGLGTVLIHRESTGPEVDSEDDVPVEGEDTEAEITD